MRADLVVLPFLLAVAAGSCSCSSPECVVRGSESCNGIDDDCDGRTDEGIAAEAERCDGIDNDCDGEVDEGVFGVKHGPVLVAVDDASAYHLAGGSMAVARAGNGQVAVVWQHLAHRIPQDGPGYYAFLDPTGELLHEPQPVTPGNADGSCSDFWSPLAAGAEDRVAVVDMDTCVPYHYGDCPTDFIPTNMAMVLRWLAPGFDEPPLIVLDAEACVDLRPVGLSWTDGRLLVAAYRHDLLARLLNPLDPPDRWPIDWPVFELDQDGRIVGYRVWDPGPGAGSNFALVSSGDGGWVAGFRPPCETGLESSCRVDLGAGDHSPLLATAQRWSVTPSDAHSRLPPDSLELGASGGTILLAGKYWPPDAALDDPSDTALLQAPAPGSDGPTLGRSVDTTAEGQPRVTVTGAGTLVVASPVSDGAPWRTASRGAVVVRHGRSVDDVAWGWSRGTVIPGDADTLALPAALLALDGGDVMLVYVEARYEVCDRTPRCTDQVGPAYIRAVVLGCTAEG